jgi:hypothetical protein
METFHLYDLAENSVQEMYASCALIPLAERFKDVFVDLELKRLREKQVGHACLEALIAYPIEEDKLTKGEHCVWNLK